MFALFDRRSFGWKTCRPSLFAEDSDSYSGTWPYSGSMRNGVCSEQPRLAPRTVESVFSFWQSPTAQNSHGNAYQMHEDIVCPTLVGQVQNWATPTEADFDRGDDGEANREGSPSLVGQALLWSTPAARDHKGSPSELIRPDGKHRMDQLDRQAENWPLLRSGLPDPMTSPPGDGFSSDGRSSRRLWPTPDAAVMNDGEDLASWEGRRDRLKDEGYNRNGMGTPLTIASQQWPSPTTMDAAGFHGTKDEGRTSELSGRTLAGVTEGPARKKRLNPRFVTWLMGLPLGLTNFEPVAMASYQRRQRSRLLSLLTVWASARR